MASSDGDQILHDFTPFFKVFKDDLPSMGCERVLVCLAEKDGLRDRGLAYCKTLNKSGWSGSVEVVETPGEDHVFHMFNFDSEETKSLLKRTADFIVQV